MQFCTNCGAPIENGNRFCTRCGKPVDASNSAPVQPVSIAPNNNLSSAKKLSTLALIIPAVAVILTFLGNLFFYLSIDMLQFLWATIPATLVTAIIAFLLPVFCKIAVATKSTSGTSILKTCTIVFLAVQLLAAVASVVLAFVVSSAAISPLLMVIYRIPGSGLFRSALSIFTLGGGTRLLSTLASTLSNLLLVGNSILCLIAAHKLSKS